MTEMLNSMLALVLLAICFQEVTTYGALHITNAPKTQNEANNHLWNVAKKI